MKDHRRQIVERHIEGARNAVLDEDLRLALKWVLKVPNSVEDWNQVTADWKIESTPIYVDSLRFQQQYILELPPIGVAIKALAESYRQRQSAGLVLVVGNQPMLYRLRQTGYRIGTVDFEAFRTAWYDAESVQRDTNYFEARQKYLDRVVQKILDKSPTLVLATPLERTLYEHGGDKHELLTAEGIQIKRQLEKTGIGFIAIARANGEKKIWEKERVPHYIGKDLEQAVKTFLGINYSLPILQ